METIIYLNDTAKNLKFETRRLEKKYESLESLRKRIVNIKCEDPEGQDDFMVWKYLRSGLKNDDIGSISENKSNGQIENCEAPELSTPFENVVECDADGQTLEVQDKPSEKINITTFTEALSFETFDIYLTITPRRMELIDYVNINAPKSVKDLATGMGRDYKNVYDDVRALSKYNLIDLVKIGRNKTPMTRVDFIQVIPRKH